MAMAPRDLSDSTRLHAAMARWLSELTRGGMFATDADLQVVAWNRWMEIHTHRLAPSHRAAPARRVSRPREPRDRSALSAALDDGRVSTLSHGLHRYLLPLAPTHPDLDLAEMPQSCHIGPLMDGEAIVGTVTTIENVSERLTSEAELRRQIEAQRIARSAAEDGPPREGRFPVDAVSRASARRSTRCSAGRGSS